MMMCGRSECGEEQFQCEDTGQCLDPEYQCDGVQDCQDGSGEYSTVHYTLVQYRNARMDGRDFHLGPLSSNLFLVQYSLATSLL